MLIRQVNWRISWMATGSSTVNEGSTVACGVGIEPLMSFLQKTFAYLFAFVYLTVFEEYGMKIFERSDQSLLKNECWLKNNIYSIKINAALRNIVSILLNQTVMNSMWDLTNTLLIITWPLCLSMQPFSILALTDWLCHLLSMCCALCI